MIISFIKSCGIINVIDFINNITSVLYESIWNQFVGQNFAACKENVVK